MQQSIVFTFACDDRPGLVEALANAVRDHGGNWLESRLSHLGGKFAGIVKVSVDRRRSAALAQALGDLAAQGITVTMAGEATADDADGPLAMLFIYGHDRPGIVHEVARALAAHRINILQFESSVTSAPMAGGPLFQAHIEARVPGDLSRERITDELHALADSLDIDLTLEWD